MEATYSGWGGSKPEIVESLSLSSYFIQQTSLTQKKIYILPTQCISVFWRISEQTVIIPLYNIKWLYMREGACLLRGTSWIFKCKLG